MQSYSKLLGLLFLSTAALASCKKGRQENLSFVGKFY